MRIWLLVLAVLGPAVRSFARDGAAAVLVVLVTPVAALAGALVLGVDVVLAPLVALMRTVRGRTPDTAPDLTRTHVLTVSWNGKEFLERLLPSLDAAIQQTPGDHEIVVVDNGSDDGTGEWLAAEWPQVRVVRLPENRFFGGGVRAGIEACDRDIVILLNNDMVVEPDALRALLAGFDGPDVAAASAQIFFSDPSKRREETGKTRGVMRAGGIELSHSAPTEDDEALVASPTFWAGGGSSAYDRRKWVEAGGFETLFDPFYAEDLSFSYQAWRRGWRCVFTPAARVYHEHRGTTARILSHEQVDNIIHAHGYLHFWRCVTDPSWTLQHFALLPFRAARGSLRNSVRFQLTALGRALLRLPKALAFRQASRFAYVRSDREVFRIANHVHHYTHRGGSVPAEVRDNGRLRILLLTGRLPRLRTDGSWILFNLIQRIGARHDVHLVSIVDSAGEDRLARELADACTRIDLVPRSSNPRTVDLHGMEPFRFLRDYADPEMTEACRRAVADCHYDLVQVEYPEMAYVLRGALAGVPSIYTQHESQYLMARRLEHTGWRSRMQALVHEVDLVRDYDRVVCLSDVDARDLQKSLPDMPVTVAPSGVDTERIRPEPDTEEPGQILFVGYFMHPPNVDAACWFARSVLPLVVDAMPEAHFHLVGREPSEEVRRLGEEIPQVTVSGYVPDLASYVARASCVVVPIRTGAGLRGKILEAWAAGKAVVSTSVAAEGFNARPGEHLLVADDPQTFARHVLAVLRDEKLRERLGTSGRVLVEEHYSADAFAEGYEDAYEAVLEGARRQ